MTARNERPGREPKTRESLSPRDRELLDRLAKEVAYFQAPGRDQLVGAKPYHRALDNAHIKDGEAREQWMELLKVEMRERARAAKKPAESARPETKSVAVSSMDTARPRTLTPEERRDAFAHEKRQPSGTYGTEEEDDAAA